MNLINNKHCVFIKHEGGGGAGGIFFPQTGQNFNQKALVDQTATNKKVVANSLWYYLIIPTLQCLGSLPKSNYLLWKNLSESALFHWTCLSNQQIDITKSHQFTNFNNKWGLIAALLASVSFWTIIFIGDWFSLF